MQKRLLFSIFSLALCFTMQAQWSLSGNANATNASKLGTTNAIPLRLFTNDQLRAYISSAGNFGIGTASPQQRLHVEGTSNQAIFVNTSALGSISGSGQIGYAKGTPTAAGNRLGYFLVGSRGGAENNFNTAGMAGYAAGAWTAGSSHPTYLTFETTPSGSTSRAERVRITASGNVGIGTTNPINKLHVVGRGRFTDGLTVSESGIYSNNTNGDGIEAIGNSSSGAGVRGNGYYGVYGTGGTYGTYGTGVYGAWGQASSASGYGVVGIGGAYGTYGSGDSYGAYGYSNAGYGTYGGSYSSIGAYGSSYNGAGVQGISTNSYGGNFESTNSWALRASTSSGYYAGVFYGQVYSSTGFTTSDRNLKQNIKSFSGAMEIINKLNPQQYEFKKEDKYAFLNLPKGNHYGLMAQELEQVLPNLVSTANHEVMKPKKETGAVKLDAKGLPIAPEIAASEKPETMSIKAVNYTELIPIMVKAMQEQQQEIENLKDQLNRLTKGQGTGASLSSATMSQNMPNPVAGNTSISYTLPAGTRNARMLVTDALGRTIKSVTLAESGTLQLNTATLSSGVYNYALIIDNQTISTRKMTVVR